MKKLIILVLLLSLLSFELVDNRSVYDLPLEASGICTTDYDLDGDMDIIINHGIDDQIHWGGIYMLQNDGFGNFIYMDSIYDTVGWVNYADTIFRRTYPDIIYRSPDSITILSFDGINYSSHSNYIGPNANDFNLGDVNDNGYLDIAFTVNNEYRWGIIYNFGDGDFSKPEYYDLDFPPQDLICADINLDGKDDVVIGGWTEINYSTGSGFIKQKLPDGGAQLGIDDFDNDGDLDIITYHGAAFKSAVYFYENEGDSVFTSYFLNPNENLDEIIIKDFNNDGLPDFLFSNWPRMGSGYLLYYNEGDFTLNEPQRIELEYFAEARRFCHSADIDGNGYYDIITTRQFYSLEYENNPLEILFNDGLGNFVETPQTSVKENTFSKSISVNCYPNPLTTFTNFEYILNEALPVEISIYNSFGDLVEIITNYQSSGSQKVMWDASKYDPGIYFYSLEAGDTYANGKIIKQNTR